jgi:hypothetical protein
MTTPSTTENNPQEARVAFSFLAGWCDRRKPANEHPWTLRRSDGTRALLGTNGYSLLWAEIPETGLAPFLEAAAPEVPEGALAEVFRLLIAPDIHVQHRVKRADLDAWVNPARSSLSTGFFDSVAFDRLMIGAALDFFPPSVDAFNATVYNPGAEYPNVLRLHADGRGFSIAAVKLPEWTNRGLFPTFPLQEERA